MKKKTKKKEKERERETKGNKQIKIICASIVFQKPCGINKGRRMTHKGMSEKRSTFGHRKNDERQIR